LITNFALVCFVVAFCRRLIGTKYDIYTVPGGLFFRDNKRTAKILFFFELTNIKIKLFLKYYGSPLA